MPMDWYEPEVRALERERTRRNPPVHPAVFYGSSSFRLWTTLAEDLHDDRVVNLGFGGSTLEACVRFFERLVPPTRPASLVVYAGDNDLGDGRTPGQVVAWFEQLAGKVERDLPRVPFGFVSIKPSPARAALIDAIVTVNVAIRQKLMKHAAGFYIDVFTAMLAPNGEARTDLFLADGLHLNQKGYQLWAQILGAHRDQIFTRSFNGGHVEGLASKPDAP
jgi:lysophospholipase L1-like esterase